MTDIVKRLRLLVPSDSSGAAFDAVDEITALRADVENLGKGAVEQAAACGRLLRELHAARTENEKLRAALRDIIADSFSLYAIDVARAALGGKDE